jgi:hypothetical protein
MQVASPRKKHEVELAKRVRSQRKAEARRLKKLTRKQTNKEAIVL